MMTYKETLDYIYSLLPMYQRIGASAYKADLGNIIELCKCIGNPHQHIKTIHVAGTNGKGTVSHLIAFGLQRQNLKVGLYTSPHYKDFRERIKINGEYISKKYVSSFIENNKAVIEKVKPSFFEVTVAMAFKYFKDKKVDVAVIEVGLGGRLDSTNIINPLLSVITNISYDHMNILGNTLTKIAAEKAGIIKPNIPVLIGEKQKEVFNVFKGKAKENKSKMYLAEELVKFKTLKTSSFDKKLQLSFNQTDIKFKTNLMANYHEKNLITAFGALALLQDTFKISFKKLAKNFTQFNEEVKYIGRWQIISKKPLIIVDSAHNEAGVKLSLSMLNQHKSNKIHFVLGFVNDKDLANVLKLFPKQSQYYFVKAAIPRALDAEQLLGQANNFDLKGKAYSSVKKGLKAAQKNAKQNEIIYVGGSIFVAAEVI